MVGPNAPLLLLLLCPYGGAPPLAGGVAQRLLLRWLYSSWKCSLLVFEKRQEALRLPADTSSQ